MCATFDEIYMPLATHHPPGAQTVRLPMLHPAYQRCRQTCSRRLTLEMLSSANAFLHTCCTIQLHSPMCSPIRQINHSFQMSSKMNWVTIQQKGICSVSTKCMAFMLVCGRWYNFKKRCHGLRRGKEEKRDKGGAVEILFTHFLVAWS